MSSDNLGNLISVHPVSPAAVLRVIVVAVLSFIFFMGTLVAFYASGKAVFFLLSSGFLVIYVLTMIGWFALRKIELRIFEGGLAYKKSTMSWEEIESAERLPKKGLRITLSGRPPITVPESLSDIDKIEAFIGSKRRKA